MNKDRLMELIGWLGPLDEDWVYAAYAGSWGNALCDLLEDWYCGVLGSGHFGVVIAGPEVELPADTVVKLCAIWDDGYPIWIEYCAANPHPSLPRVYDYGWSADGIFWCILPRYEPVGFGEFEEAWYGTNPDATARRQYWESLLSDFEGLSDIDVHEGNIMRDQGGGYILTDPLGHLTPDTCLDDARQTLMNRGLI